MDVITASETNIAITTGVDLSFRQNSVNIRLPNKAPAVNPRKAKAAFKTEGLSRVRNATKINAAAQKTVDALLKRRKKSSVRFPPIKFFMMSIVETDARAVKAELTLDIAAE